jgi:hypothetical protein
MSSDTDIKGDGLALERRQSFIFFNGRLKIIDGSANTEQVCSTNGAAVAAYSLPTSTVTGKKKDTK